MNLFGFSVLQYVFVVLTENKEVGMGAIIITTDVLLMMDNLQWLFPKPDLATQTYSSQKISNLIEVVSMEKCKYFNLQVFTITFMLFKEIFPLGSLTLNIKRVE
jgi:hypothetical protein